MVNDEWLELVIIRRNYFRVLGFDWAWQTILFRPRPGEDLRDVWVWDWSILKAELNLGLYLIA